MKKILATVATMAAAFAWAADPAGDTSADVLVWYIDTEDAQYGGAQNFDEIKFWAVSSDSTTELGLGGLTYTDPDDLRADRYADLSGRTRAAGDDYQITPTRGTTAGTYYTDLSGLDNGYSFMMELYNAGEKVDWMVSAISMDKLQEASGLYSIASSDYNLSPSVDGMNFGEEMVPEPTSGLLLLVGGALLALRRRRSREG